MTMTHASGIGNLSKTRADLAARHLSSIILYGYCRCLDAMHTTACLLRQAMCIDRETGENHIVSHYNTTARSLHP